VNTNRHIGDGQSKVCGFTQIPSQSKDQAAIASIPGEKLKNPFADAATVMALSTEDEAAIPRIWQ
jgi:hypothetical protein